MAWMMDMLNRNGGAVAHVDPSVMAMCLSLGDTVAVYDQSSNIIEVHGDTRVLLDVPAHALIEQGLFRRINVGDRPAYLKALSDAVRLQKPTQAVIRARSGDWDVLNPEEMNWLEIRFTVIGGVTIGALRNVDESRAREDEIATAHRAAAEASEAKDRFLATVSHELRTPLNAIIGFSEILASDAVGPVSDERRKEYATIIKQSGEHLLEVVNMLLDMSKLEAGKFIVEPESFSVRDLLSGVCDMMALRAAQSGVDLVRDVAADMPDIISDRRALRQVLINLVSNAVKFTPTQGRVAVRAEMKAGALNINIRDTGIGIPEDELPKLGTPFFQAKSSYDRSHEGTGLGLSVVRRLMGLLGGTIHLASRIGHGTSITIRLPLDARELVQPGIIAPLVTSLLARPEDELGCNPPSVSAERILKRA